MNESRVTKSSINAITAVLQNLINILLTFIARIIFVHYLNSSYLGINGLFSNILNVLSLSDLGISTAMMYSLYKPIATGDKEKITALISFFKKIYLTIAVVILTVGIMLIPLLPYIVNLTKPIEGLEGYYLLALLNVVISYLFVYRTTLLAADQKSYILNNYIIVFRFINFIVQTIILIIFRNYFLYLFVALITNFVSNLVQNQVTIKKYPYLKGIPRPISSNEKKQIGRNVKDLFLYKICGTIQNNTDSILISVMVGTVFVGYYSNYQVILTAIVSLITVVFTAIKASIGNLVASKDSTVMQKLSIYWVLELINYWIIAFCSISFICLFQDCIDLFFGSEYVLPMNIVIAMVLNFYTSNIRQTIWAYRETTGIFHDTRYITGITAIINLILSCIMGYFWGMFGILIATVISRIIYAWWKEPEILFKMYFGTSPKKYYAIYIKRFILTLAVCGITYYMCNVVSVSNVYTMFLCKILICLILPNLIFFLFFVKTPEFKYIYTNLKKILEINKYRRDI